MLASFFATLLAIAAGALPVSNHQTCVIPGGFCGDFSTGTFAGWDDLNGNTQSMRAVSRYFRIVPSTQRLPTGRTYFRSTVDAGAREPGEPGQKSTVYLFPHPNRARAKTAAWEGSEQWYHVALAFPHNFRPSPETDWNWLVQWHNWPDSVTNGINIGLTVDTHRVRRRGPDRPGERLALRIMGGGDRNHPVDEYDDPRDNPRVRIRSFIGERRLRRGHWYDVLVHVRWSHRADRGLVEWWLDGEQIMSVRMPTLFWYGDDGTGEGDEERSGPGQAYWMIGYYRPHEFENGRVDRSVASVLFNGARRGPTRESVAFR